MLHKDLPLLNTPQGSSKGPRIPRKGTKLQFRIVIEGLSSFKESWSLPGIQKWTQQSFYFNNISEDLSEFIIFNSIQRSILNTAQGFLKGSRKPTKDTKYQLVMVIEGLLSFKESWSLPGVQKWTHKFFDFNEFLDVFSEFTIFNTIHRSLYKL